MAEQHAIDIPALSRWLQQNVEGFAGPLALDKFPGGQSNPTFKLSTPSRSYVLRCKPGPMSKLLPSAHAIEREFAVMRGLAGTNVPVPGLYGLCEDEAVIGRVFYVMELLQGRVLWDQALPKLSRAHRSRIYDEMNLSIAALHTIDFAQCGLASYGKPGNYIHRQIARWSRQYEASIDGASPTGGRIPEMEKLMEWLPRNLPAAASDDSKISLVHGDYRLDNLMFHPEEPLVVAVLDWELSTLGHPLADFNYHCMVWRIPYETSRGIGGLDLQSLGIPSEDEYIRRYCERTRLEQPEALKADWNFYLAYNLFRVAAILQGIAKRAESGTASSSRTAGSSASARQMATLAWGFAQQA